MRLASESDVQDDLAPSPGNENYTKNQVTCPRDLENFARLWIRCTGAGKSLFASGQLTMKLAWRPAAGTTPAINVYDAAPKHGVSTNAGGTDYLTDAPTANDQAFYQYSTSRGKAGAGAPLELSLLNSTFSQPTDDPHNIYLLFEGAARGQGRLVVRLYKDSNQIAESDAVYMDLRNVKELYERWTVGDGNGGTPNAVAAPSTEGLNGLTGLQYSSGDPGLSITNDANGNAYILYVHGWNMHPWEKDAFAETMLKRLYWQGYKGKFGAFQWPTTVGVLYYDSGEYTAWQSAIPLESKLHDLSSQYTGVYVLAHSMGNVVVGEALRRASQDGYGNLVNTYVATQAAVPGNCYDPSLAGSDLLDFGPLGIYGPTTPNIYNSWLAVNAAGNLANYYNVNDWALGWWQVDQRTKPDSYSGPHSPYNYPGDPNTPPVEFGFYAYYGLSGQYALDLGSATNVMDRYEIMAFASEPRSKALGGVPSVAGFSPLNLAMNPPWPTDTYAGHDYSVHLWHSGQFEFTNADMQGYWQQLLKQFFNLPTTVP